MRSAFVQDAKKQKRDIQVVRIVKDVMTKKDFFPGFFMSGDQMQKNFDQKRTTNRGVFCHAPYL